MSKLCIILPTYEADTMQNYLVPSIHKLKPELDIYCENGIKKVFYEEYITTSAPYHLPVLISDDGKWSK